MRTIFSNPTDCQAAQTPDTFHTDQPGAQSLQDIWHREQMVPGEPAAQTERHLHAKGAGAYGAFTVTHDITRFTCAKLFSRIGKKTDLFARFSTVCGAQDVTDADRAIRGFAVRFYTEDGNWDLVGNNTPVYFVRDPANVARLNQAMPSDPGTGSSWDLWTTLPEALHQLTMLMSDRGIPASYRHMHGFASHTFSFINANNERHWVKFHFKTCQGIRNLSDAQAQVVISKNRASHQKDLFDAIEDGKFPKWTLMVQLMPQRAVAGLAYNPFDRTKVWPHQDFPLLPVGVMELHRNPADFFAEVEQSAFNPTRIVPGIDFSPDPMLQERLSTYPQAQRDRLGDPPDQRPLNAAHAPSSGAGEDDYSQPGALFRRMTSTQQQVLYENTARALGDAPRAVQLRHIEHCKAADPTYGSGVAQALSKIALRPAEPPSGHE